jgi:aldose 1-epimerase
VELTAGAARVVVRPEAGGRLEAVTIAGYELLVHDNGDPLGWGCFPMAPWAGRVRHGRFTYAGVTHRLPLDLPPHAIHGTTYRRPWEIVSSSEDRCTLTCSLGETWPWPGRAQAEVVVDPGGLHLRLALEADEPMPATVGWHPWFTRNVHGAGELETSFEAAERWERDDEGIPTGKLVPAGERPVLGWDDCFAGVVEDPVLSWPGAVEVTLHSNCEHWVFYDFDPYGVCLEPQTGPPDALNLGPAVVEPGAPLVATYDWTWRLG